LGLYNTHYSNAPFVRFLGEKIPQLKDAVGTNFCLIGIAFDERTGTLKIFSTIDNLLKGAAGQAVQNMNLIFNFDQKEGLSGYGIFS
jgi:N-acetyl-gamma-glutamyl-phosphate reductase